MDDNAGDLRQQAAALGWDAVEAIHTASLGCPVAVGWAVNLRTRDPAAVDREAG
jgi:hypothetical protein